MKNNEVIVVTDRFKSGDKTALFAKMPLFNKGEADISGPEAVVLSWIIIDKYSSYNREGKVVSYALIGRLLSISARQVARIVTSLTRKRLVVKELVKDTKGMKLHFSGASPGKEYRAVTHALVTTKLFSFKLKGFIASMLLTSNEYIIRIKSYKDVAKRIGADKDTVSKYMKELDTMGYVRHIDNLDVLDLRAIFIDNVLDLEKQLVEATEEIMNIEDRLNGEFEDFILDAVSDSRLGEDLLEEWKARDKRLGDGE